ncbi:hypothetical protein HX063_16950 [Myroides odoratimimus]|uniref:hypothetical protein n=1 Tax=Myroides odoratimimus TaxID=76832 RepID=UPI0025764327|nr:hypothetical protein [Myroides odoratimimus]MDM1497060.1 hypothetical protein [Myroides odoratimimus]
MKNKYIKIGLLFLVGFTFPKMFGQIKVGDNPENINQNSILEIESANKGVLLPRLELISTSSFMPLSAHVEGMTIYNTATAGSGLEAVIPGYYYNDGSKWNRIANVNDIKKQPWLKQETRNEATENTDNIYQKGKVAVGFDESDIVSDRQLEVKGHFKTEMKTGGRLVGIDTNFGELGIGMYNIDDIENPTNVAMVRVDPTNSVHLIAQSPTNLAGVQIIPGLIEYRTGNWGVSDGMSLYHMDNNQIFLRNESGEGNDKDVAALRIMRNNGIQFAYSDSEGNRIGDYTFPKDSGEVGQVLAVNVVGDNTSRLQWKSIEDLVDIGGASNGLTKNSTLGDIQLGGELIKPTEIITDNVNTIALQGLMEVSNENVLDGQYHMLLRSPTTGILYSSKLEDILEEVVSEYETNTTLTFDTNTSVLTYSNESHNNPIIDLSGLKMEPWQVQGGINQATTNSENIYQIGSVAIGANTIPLVTAGNITINPMLYVDGDISTTGKLWTTNSTYADYVFEKYFEGNSKINNSYEFMSLDYVKEFIEKNKHLPGVTKIDALSKDEKGFKFDLTELSIQQLEKVEELFIHIIEQNEQIIELRKQLKNNDKRLKTLENLLLVNNQKKFN